MWNRGVGVRGAPALAAGVPGRWASGQQASMRDAAAGVAGVGAVGPAGRGAGGVRATARELGRPGCCWLVRGR
jgi:hypothetical protein